MVEGEIERKILKRNSGFGFFKSKYLRQNLAIILKEFLKFEITVFEILNF